MLTQGLNHNRQGFTLVELIVTITILAVVASIAYPKIMALLKHQESVTVRSNLQNFLTTGKQYSLVYQAPIHLCIANKDNQCVTSNGSVLLTFLDKDNSNTFTPADTLLETHSLSLKYARLVTHVALARSYIVFKAETGRPTGYEGRINYCPIDGNQKEMFKITFSKTAVIKIKSRQEENIDC